MKRDDLSIRLARAFPPPDRQRKRAFFRQLPPQPVSHLRLLLDQAGRIRPLSWVLSLGVFFAALAGGRLVPAEALWLTAALTPFAALAAVTEAARPALYGMEELELSSRFGLKSVVLARMGAMGLVHGLLLAALAAGGQAGFLRSGTYFLTPYLLTDLLGLAITRRFRGREALYGCAAAAVLTAGLALALHGVRDVYALANFRWWLLALAAAAALTGREYRKTIKKTEELSWSL